MSKIINLRLKNLTVFSELNAEFSEGVNIFIGENGTGKTHLLKILYSACSITEGENREKSFSQKLCNVFLPYEGRIGRLSRRQNKSVNTQISIIRSDHVKLETEFSNHTKTSEKVIIKGDSKWKKSELISAYIPVKEMLAHAPGFLSTFAKRELTFEEVYPDIIKKAFLPILKGAIDQDRQKLLSILQKALDGKVIAKGEFFFLKNKHGELEFNLLAEGMRKLALIWLLIQNGVLLSGSVLFWDEPEANLNPKLIGELVDVILELQRIGVQIFLSTHNYVLLKEFDLRLEKTDQIRYFSLFRSITEKENNKKENNNIEDHAVSIQSSKHYLEINPNAIASTFTNMYDREISRSLKNHK